MSAFFFSKKGLNVLLKDGIKNITRHSNVFEKLNVLFVENAEKEIAVLYKGKKFFQANSSGRTGKFLDYLYSKAGGNTAKLEEEMSRLVGMAENIRVPTNIITVEKFEAGWKALEEAIKNGILTAENAIDFIDEARIYFNHIIKINAQGEKEVVQIASHNCVEVVKVVEEFFRTGKIKPAAFSKAQDYYVLEELYNRPFITYNLGTLRTKEEIMAIGDRGILLCERTGNLDSHVINILKVEKDRIKYIEGQVILNEMNLLQEFKSFKFLKTN